MKNTSFYVAILVTFSSWHLPLFPSGIQNQNHLHCCIRKVGSIELKNEKVDKMVLIVDTTKAKLFTFEKQEYPYILLKNGIDLVENEILRTGRWDWDFIQDVKQYIKPGTNFVDVGANLGYWSLIMADHSTTVFAFEPQRMIYNQLCGNIFLNQKENVITINCGLGTPKQHGTVMNMYKTPNNAGAARFEQCVQQELYTLDTTEVVELRTFDSFKLDNISLIKIDVEGYELNVLKGATETLARCKPIVILELWALPEFVEKKLETIKYISSLGYKLLRSHGENMIFVPV